jgi:hypothetical protein
VDEVLARLARIEAQLAVLIEALAEDDDPPVRSLEGDLFDPRPERGLG